MRPRRDELRAGTSPWHLLPALALLGALPAAGQLAAIDWAGCPRDPQVAAALVEPAQLARRCGEDVPCWRDGVEAARTLRDRHPDDYDAHRSYVVTVRAAARRLGADAAAAVAAEYAAAAAAAPEEPAFAHLRAQLELDGAAWEAELESLALRFPAYPWARLSLALLARPDDPPARRARAVAAFESFVLLCPERPAEAALALARLGDGELWERYGAGLRERAVGARDAAAAARLWELAATWEGDRGRELAEAIAADIEALTAGGIPTDVVSIEALRRGLRRVGDRAAEAQLDDHLLAVQPCAPESAAVLAGRLLAGRELARLRAPEERAAWVDAALARLAPARAACPSGAALLDLEIDLLALGGAAYHDRLLAVLDARAGLAGAAAPDPLWTASLLLDRELRPERVGELLAGAPADDPRTLRLRLRHALALGDPGAARRLLTELPVDDPERARLELELRCLTGEREAALAGLAAELAGEPRGGPGERAAFACWRRDGGDLAGFEVWRRSVWRGAGEAGAFEVVDLPLPEMPLQDLDGPFDWQERRGRTIVLRAFASWCAPCRDEQEVLARLTGRLAERRDVELRLLTVDAGLGELLELIGTGALALEPVFAGPQLFDGALERVPATLIVSPQGRIVRRQTGVIADPQAWLAATLAEIDAVASGGGPASAADPDS